MAFLRVRHPSCPPKDVDLGPSSGRVHDWRAIRKTVDDDRGIPLPWLRGLNPGGGPRELGR